MKSRFFILGTALSTLLLGCDKGDKAPVPEQTLPTAAVRVVKVENLPRMAVEEVVGTVRPKLSASISSKISGVIEKMLVYPGQQVKKGDLLVQIDARETQARLDQAQAVREQTQKDIGRFEILLKQGTVAQQEFDNAQARYRVAEATAAEAKTMLDYSKITAPFDGVITAKRADVGDLAAPGKALLEMEDSAALRVETDIPDALIGKIKLGDSLKVRVSSAPAVIGLVGEIAPAGDPLSRTFRVKLDLPANSGLRSGQFARVAVPVSEINALRVPTNAVCVRGQMEMVFVAAGQHAQMRLVKTGKQWDDAVEIVSGLSGGEKIVLGDLQKLQEGQPLEIKE